MIFKIIRKEDVMGLLWNEDLYVLKVSTRNGNMKYCSSKQVSSLTVREIAKAISDNDTAFIEIKKES